jgi:quercetin dioxygenase-like cupin family protein
MNPPSADPSLQRVERVFPSLAEEVAMTENAGAPTGVVFDLANHVDYADGSVVSKTLLQKNTGGKPHEVKSGEMLIMPANVSHALHAAERFKMLLVMIRGE